MGAGAKKCPAKCPKLDCNLEFANDRTKSRRRSKFDRQSFAETQATERWVGVPTNRPLAPAPNHRFLANRTHAANPWEAAGYGSTFPRGTKGSPRVAIRKQSGRRVPVKLCRASPSLD